MQITLSRLQKYHSLLVDALERGEVVELTYHGKVIGVIRPKIADVESETGYGGIFWHACRREFAGS